uniref:Uncharacterized protein n=1 Tax=Knipowitschia caucasica TaxID=637954 RepID=A0AAV2KKU6_KNICA
MSQIPSVKRTVLLAASEILDDCFLHCFSLRPRSVRPRSVRPRSVRPRSVRPRSVRPRSVRPRSVRPRSVRPRSVRPCICYSLYSEQTKAQVWKF